MQVDEGLLIQLMKQQVSIAEDFNRIDGYLTERCVGHFTGGIRMCSVIAGTEELQALSEQLCQQVESMNKAKKAA